MKERRTVSETSRTTLHAPTCELEGYQKKRKRKRMKNISEERNNSLKVP